MRNIVNRLSSLPQVNIKRSKFDMTPHHHLTTLNAGELIPIYVLECLPGATYKLQTRDLVRMSTPIHPVMDDCYLDTYFFFVPNRLVWDNWEEFMGENKTSYWTKDMPSYTVPQLTFPIRGAEKGSIADYMGIPTDVTGISVNALPFRAYRLIWNEWFRDENVFAPVFINTSKNDNQYGSMAAGPFATSSFGAHPLPVCKFHDYFTTSLPSPQRGPDVMLPLGDFAPVATSQVYTDNRAYGDGPVLFRPITGESAFANFEMLNINVGGYLGSNPDDSIQTADTTLVVPSNLIADLSQATAATINELRMAFALQSFYEASARYGGRYTELLRGHFGVVSPDARLQRPEYIGGKRVKINMQQVLQTSATNEVSPQGNTAAFSLTADSDKSFTYSSVEHGYIIGLCCVRTKQTYQYGIERFWSRKDMTDFYFPEFAHIGEQPVYNKEIFAAGTDADDEVFGYQEAWADYRQKFSRVSGAYRSNYAQTLDSWHYAEKYSSAPTLSAAFMEQGYSEIDRTLAVSSSVEDQFLCDFCFELTAVLPMPMYSIPGFGMRF